MIRLKITWKWNGEKIREDSRDEMVDADMEELGAAPWKVMNKACLTKEDKICENKPCEMTFKGRDANGNMVQYLPIPARAQPVGFIRYTNLIYQLLEGEVVCG